MIIKIFQVLRAVTTYLLRTQLGGHCPQDLKSKSFYYKKPEEQNKKDLIGLGLGFKLALLCQGGCLLINL
jgi:hypothetical protein